MTQTGVGTLVDLFRSLPGVEPSKRDGPRIAGLVKQFGAARVKAILEARGEKIGQARVDPLALLATYLRKGEQGQRAVPDVGPTTRWADQLRQQAATAGRSAQTEAEIADLRARLGVRARSNGHVAPASYVDARTAANRARMTHIGSVLRELLKDEREAALV
ncbi:MAG: hypothetical protein ACYDAB_08200 [bacterium]